MQLYLPRVVQRAHLPFNASTVQRFNVHARVSFNGPFNVPFKLRPFNLHVFQRALERSLRRPRARGHDPVAICSYDNDILFFTRK